MKVLQEGFIVVSRVIIDDKLAGFLLVDSVGDLHKVTLDQINSVGDRAVYKNAEYSKEYKTLVGVDGVSLTHSPSINNDFVLLSRNGITVLCTILDEATDKPIGVVAYNGIGARFNLKYDKLEVLAKRNTCCNFQMVNDAQYGTIAVKKDGSYFEVVRMKAPKVEADSGVRLPAIKVYSMDDISNNEFTQSCQDKLVRAMINMRKLTPYYYTVMSAIKRLPANCGTMGVTEDTLYYDLKFAANLQVPELTFVLIHEVDHIAMQHSIRFGKRKNRKLWNVACDLYINSIICNDYNCSFGTEGNDLIKTPQFGVYMETVGKKIDLAVDTPESIYDELMKENQNTPQMPMQSGGGNGSGDSDGGQSGSGGQNDAGDGQDDGDGNQSGNGGSQSNKSQGGNDVFGDNPASNNSTSGRGSGNNGGSDEDESGSGGSSGKDNSMDNSDSSGESESESESESEDGMQNVDVIYNGQRLTGTIMRDIYRSENTSEEAAIEKGKQALQNIKTKIKMEEEKLGESLSKTAGTGAGLTNRYIEFGLSNGVDWKILFRNICKDKPKKTFTLAQPNQDYMSMGMTLASRRPIGKPTHISRVKFAIDVSGSVSQKELRVILSEINNIYTQFDMDGELIYWSTEIGDVGMFSSMRDMLRIKPNTTGGTDVKCVFDYLARKIKVNGRYEEDRIRDIKAVFILTDGCFRFNFDEYERMFGKRVVWLITGIKGNPITFNPPFGRVVGINIDD